MAMAGKPPEAAFLALPSRKLLTDLVESVRDEVAVKWVAKVADEYPILGQLWISVQTVAEAQLEKDPDAPAAFAFRAEWEELDRRFGDLLARELVMKPIEAFRRELALMRYLHRSGLLELREAEADAPRHYLADRELEGE